MTGRLFIAGIILLIAGIIGRIYAGNYTHVDANGVLRDTAWMPISAFMMLAGFVLLLVSFVLYGIAYLRRGQTTV